PGWASRSSSRAAWSSADSCSGASRVALVWLRLRSVMSRKSFPWLLTGGAVAVIVYIGTRPSGRQPVERAAGRTPRAQGLRNAGSLNYRSIGKSGDRYPAWVRALRGKSGVYLIRERQRDDSNPIVYIGESHTARLYQTLTRHFQTWRRAKKFWAGQYGGQ